MDSTVFELTGKSAVVTGGSSGIGRAIARRFHQAGARVLVADRHPTEDDFAYYEADISREEDVSKMLDTAREQFGKVDILVNNAGIQPLGVSFDRLTPPLLERTFSVNVHGVAYGIKHGGRVLCEGGRVVNTSSFVGMVATPGATAYAASKAAVIHLTRLGAIELAPRRITVNAVSPGTIRTPAVTSIADNPEIPFMEKRTPLGRLGEPEEVAALCHFLASDEAAYITGQNIAIDGGLTAGWTEYDLISPANIQNGRWVDDV
jgi:NAD(P)-dependent dehydrogenase (short-subunit alcohol dehydrogenase family)